MRILNHTFYVLHIIIHNALECSHPCGISIDPSSTELLKSDAQIAIYYVFILLVNLSQQRLIIVLCIEFGRYHIKRYIAVFTDTILLIGEIEFEHSWFIQEVQLSREGFFFPSIQLFINKETILYVFSYMADFWYGAFIYSME